MNEVGDLLAGRYRLESRMSANGPWFATDEHAQRPVVIERLAARSEDQARQWAPRGDRTATRVEHPNIVAVHETLPDGGASAVVMEYFPSRSLAGLLAERGSLPVEEAATIGAQVAAALAAAQDAGVVHGAVEPSAVLLGSSGVAKVTDFASRDDVAEAPAYLAPEVARGNAPTAASDVFSLGATLHAALEGNPPFGLGTDNPLAVLHEAAAGVVPPAPHAGRAAPILARMMHEDPAARPRPQQVRDSLRALLDGRPVPTHFPLSEDLTQPMPAVPATPAQHDSSTEAPEPPASDSAVRRFTRYSPLLLAAAITVVVVLILTL